MAACATLSGPALSLISKSGLVVERMGASREPGAFQEEAPLCAACGAETPTLEAIVYHGVVYHPACVAPTLSRKPVRPQVEPDPINDVGERR